MSKRSEKISLTESEFEEKYRSELSERAVLKKMVELFLNIQILQILRNGKNY